MNETIVVTGARGNLARRLLRLLGERRPEARVIAVARNQPAPAEAKEFLAADLREARAWECLPDTVTHVFHLAAAIPWEKEHKTRASVLDDNLLPIDGLIGRSAGWPKLRQVVYSSSVSVYGRSHQPLSEDSPTNPVDFYARSKLLGEDRLLALRQRGVRVACLRYGSLYGQGQFPGTVLPTMVRDAITTAQIHVHGTGERRQDFLHYDEAAEAAFLAYRCSAAGVYNIGSGSSACMSELARLVADVFTNGGARVVYHPEAGGDCPGFRMDIAQARREMGYAPSLDLKSGLERLKHEMQGGRG